MKYVLKFSEDVGGSYGPRKSKSQTVKFEADNPAPCGIKRANEIMRERIKYMDMVNWWTLSNEFGVVVPRRRNG